MGKQMQQSEDIQPGNDDMLADSFRVSVSASPERDWQGGRCYRSEYALEELDKLYVDILILLQGNLWVSGKKTITVRLFYGLDSESICVAEKTADIDIEEGRVCFLHEEFFSKEELAKPWQAGIYRVMADLEWIVGSSSEILVLEGTGNPTDYLMLFHVGLDRCAEENKTGNEEQRPVSFRAFNKEGLENVSLNMMFLNRYSPQPQCPYEFIIRVVRPDGRIVTQLAMMASNYIKGDHGDHLLWVAVMLGYNKEPVYPGEYTVIISCLGKVILKLDYLVGDQDIPYNYEEEVSHFGGYTAYEKPELTASSVEDKEAILDRLYRLVGLRKVKEEITQIMDYADFIRLRKENGFSDQLPAMHLIFTGHPGTGKNTVAEMMGQLYCTLGLLTNGQVNHYGRQDLLREGAAEEEQLVRQALKNSEGGILFIDQAGDLFSPENQNDRGIVVLGVLFNILTRERPKVLVILSDEDEEMDLMLKALPDLKKVFPRHLCFEDYTPEELMEITRYKLEKLQYRFSPAAEEKFYKQLKMACTANEVDFTNGRYIDEQLEEAAMRMSRRLMANRAGEYKKEDLMLIQEEDIVAQTEGNPGKSLEKLNAMIGLEPLKQSIVQHLNYVYFIRERQKHGFSDVMPPLNMIFSGNPGTGKMTVAKMMGEIYHTVGILARPNVVVQDGRNLTPETGMTPQQAVDLLMRMSDGGMLYIDHADVLPQSEFGLALFEGILSCISTETCGDSIITLGGYPDRISGMLETNPALKSYFPNIFQFNDYLPEELMQIAENKLKEKNYVFHPKAKEVLSGLVRKAYESRNKNFGNVLLVDKIVELAIRNMSERTMKIRQERELTRQEITTIREDDIPVNVFEIPKFEQDRFAEEDIQTALEELDQMVGQPRIKKQIRDFVELARHYSREGVKLSSKMSLQWCFTGNSAMGKGTVARIIARLYKAMGIISTGKVQDFKVERMIGLMEEEAQRSIGEALAKSNGGILLFDEDSPKLNEAVGFRERVRAILMNQMAERPGSYIVIYAEPRAMVPGLSADAEHLSELMNVLMFEDYTKEELMIILKRRLDKENMKMTATTRQHMNAFIGSLVSTEERSHASSRLMRIVADMIVRNCLQRIAKNRGMEKAAEAISVQKQDVAMFTEQFVSGIMQERKRIGFV